MSLFYEKDGKLFSFGLTIGDSFEGIQNSVKKSGKIISRSGTVINIPYCKISDSLPIVTLGFRLRGDSKIDNISLKGSMLTPTNADKLYAFLTEMFNKNHYTVELLHRNGNNILVSTFYNDSIRISISKYKDFGIRGKDAVSLSAFSPAPKNNPENVVKNATKKASQNHNNLKTLFFIFTALVGMGLAFFFGRMTKVNSENQTNGLYSTDAKETNSTEKGVVYICTGLNARKYHSSPDCRWLENCSGEIKEITIEEAQRQGKTPCKGCH